MSTRPHAMAEERPATRSPRPRLLLVCVVALVGGFGLSAALTASLAAEHRQGVGEWGAIVLFAAAALPLAVIDARTRRLPNLGTLPLAAGLLGYWTGLAATTGLWPRLGQAAIATAAILAIVTLTALIGTLSAGDMKLFLSIGLLTAWFSWMLPLYALAAGYLIAIPHAAILLARKRTNPDRDTRLPFGPYLIAAAIAAASVAAIVT